MSVLLKSLNPHIDSLALLPAMCRREALLRWKQKLGDDATYRNLITAFELAGHKDYGNFIRSILGNVTLL